MNQIKKGEPHISDLRYGGFEAGHLWADPKNDQASAFYLDANFEKAFKIDDISSVFHYELINDIGIRGSFVTGEENDNLRFENFDVVLNADEIANLPTIGLTEASEDFVLDVDFSKKVPELDYRFCEELSLKKTSSIVDSPETSSEGHGASKSFIPASKGSDNQSGKTTCGKSQDVFSHKCGYGTAIVDESPHTCDLQNSNKGNEAHSVSEVGTSLDPSIDNACSILASTKASSTSACLQDDRLFSVSEGLETEGVSTGDLSADSSSEQNITSARQRRLCKPPKRYMEGSLWFQSRLYKAMESPGSTSKGKDLGVVSQRKHYCKRKVPKALRNSSLWNLDSDDEYDPSSSKFWDRKSGKKRRGKKANVWTVDEVIMLVDGLARFGVGQWTAVQRACFNSSCRTATDIRDKWRNLVNYSCKHSERKRKGDQQQRNCAHPLPTYIIERVRELATSQPVRRTNHDREPVSHAEGTEEPPVT